MLAIYILSKLQNNFLQKIPQIHQTNLLLELIRRIDAVNWNSAKELWVTEFMHFNKNVKKINLFGSERENFFEFIKGFQKHQIIQQCLPNCNFNGYVLGEEFYIYLKKENNQVFIDSLYGGPCPGCRTNIQTSIRLSFHIPNFVFIEALTNNLIFSELPKELLIDASKRRYKLLCAKIYNLENLHFTAIFDFNNDLFLVDGLNNGLIDHLPPYIPGSRLGGIKNAHRKKINVCMYYLI